MANPFGTDEMAAGYAASRPPVHPRVLARVKPHVAHPVRRALDVGCGAGVSTRALQGWAGQRIGMEPAEAMLRWAGTVAPGAEFVVGAAEAMPLRGGSIDLMTAAGSLNYVDLDRFFPEAVRVLTAKGVLVAYDFSAGRQFRDGAGLEGWFSRFQERYPSPPNEARELTPAILAGMESGFRVRSQEWFAIGIGLSRSFYLDYVMTETNVAFAVRNGVPLGEIRSWCEGTLGDVWAGGEREVVFRGYFACMEAEA